MACRALPSPLRLYCCLLPRRRRVGIGGVAGAGPYQVWMVVASKTEALNCGVIARDNSAVARRAARHEHPSTAPSPRSPLRAGARLLGASKALHPAKATPFLRNLYATMVQNMMRGVLLAASLHCARGNAHEPTRAPTTQAAAPTPRPTMTDRRGGKADEIPVRAAAFAAAGFAALGLIAAAVWHESRVERVGPSSPSLPRGLARKRCGTPRLGWHAWTPRLAQPRAPRGRLLPSRSRVRPTATQHWYQNAGTAPRPPRRPTPTNSRRTPRARLHS